MICKDGLPFINDYVTAINDILKSEDKQLSQIQCLWLRFVLLGILITNSVCWSKFERYSIGIYSIGSLSWMFKKAKLYWNLVLISSIRHIIKLYRIKSAILVIDDSDKSRSKNTKNIAKAHKIKDKKTAGYFNGQNIIFLLLVANGITLPVGFALYEPDPGFRANKKERQKFKQRKVAKGFWSKLVNRSLLYPTKIELALKLLSDFMKDFKEVKVVAVVADSLYGGKEFISEAINITKQKQIITELRSNQNIVVNNKTIQLVKFFKQYCGKSVILQLRYKNRHVNYVACKFKVKSHNRKYWIIALKYDDEESYRYIIASDMSYLATDIIQTFSLRWLIEIFIQDWKSNEGWGSMAKQPGIDGSIRGIILSLLCDHALLTHPEQIALYKKWEPAFTVGSLRENILMDSLLRFIKTIIDSDNPQQLFDDYKTKINHIFQLKHSTKDIRNNFITNITSKYDHENLEAA